MKLKNTKSESLETNLRQTGEALAEHWLNSLEHGPASVRYSAAEALTFLLKHAIRRGWQDGINGGQWVEGFAKRELTRCNQEPEPEPENKPEPEGEPL
jgi:hypothetical protein